MEIEKAIETLNEISKEMAIRPETRYQMAVIIAIQTLEKQVAKPVVIKNWSPAKCPTCGMGLSESQEDGYYKHFTWIKRCPNPECAQLLKWEDEDASGCSE